MAKVTTKIEEIVSHYSKELEKMGIQVEKVFLYGSYAHGRSHEGSDIDLIIISSDFGNMGLLKRMETLGAASGRIMEPVEAFGFTPEEIDKGELPPFLSEILEKEAIAL